RVLAGDAEVEADALGVADVQVAVRLRREARDDAATVPSGAGVVGDDLADEVRAGRRGLERGRRSGHRAYLAGAWHERDRQAGDPGSRHLGSRRRAGAAQRVRRAGMTGASGAMGVTSARRLLPVPFVMLLAVAPVSITDRDGDGVPDATDNCPAVANP